MAECTPAERELLDALNGAPNDSLAEARAKLAISRVPHGLLELAITARAHLIRASEMNDKAWAELNELGVPGKWSGNTRAFDSFYDSIEAAAKERVK